MFCPPLRQFTPLLHSRRLRLSRSLPYSSNSRASLISEQVTVDCRSNGSITLDVCRATDRADPSRIVLFLPTGPVVDHYASINDDNVIRDLSRASQATVVRVNYRLAHGYFYPTPIHDVLAGYDWVLENLAPTAEANRRTGYRPRIARLGVCGQLVGGSLATMLALTECRMGGDRIAAAALHSPIVDWLFPDPSTLNGNGATGFNALPASLLIRARQTFFRNPANWFDPLASAILFFRTPGSSILSGASDHHIPSTANANFVEDFPLDYSDASAFVPIAEAEPSTSTPSQHVVPRRRAHRVFPPQGSALRLPFTRISTSSDSILYDQSAELTKLMQRSLVRTSLKAAGMLHPDALEERDRAIAEMEAEKNAEKRVSFLVGQGKGAGLWGVPGTEWEEEVEQTGLWFKEALD
ncbi:alpha/beta-hydrolase [Rhizodiscina lignyota]|uniref:Alpha/beta-hydrolase n=1 Tax=Rhizodiscina lignyota TaxID=1504668 RepID=A0A9P4I5M5_9PEZI|nr:alpha/beta-hydrolase [Rhizodiscina lignyota]